MAGTAICMCVLGKHKHATTAQCLDRIFVVLQEKMEEFEKRAARAAEAEAKRKAEAAEAKRKAEAEEASRKAAAEEAKREAEAAEAASRRQGLFVAGGLGAASVAATTVAAGVGGYGVGCAVVKATGITDEGTAQVSWKTAKATGYTEISFMCAALHYLRKLSAGRQGGDRTPSLHLLL